MDEGRRREGGGVGENGVRIGKKEWIHSLFCYLQGE
jgi:hypothetical protein